MEFKDNRFSLHKGSYLFRAAEVAERRARLSILPRQEPKPRIAGRMTSFEHWEALEGNVMTGLAGSGQLRQALWLAFKAGWDARPTPDS